MKKKSFFEKHTFLSKSEKALEQQLFDAFDLVQFSQSPHLSIQSGDEFLYINVPTSNKSKMMTSNNEILSNWPEPLIKSIQFASLKKATTLSSTGIRLEIKVGNEVYFSAGLSAEELSLRESETKKHLLEALKKMQKVKKEDQ